MGITQIKGKFLGVLKRSPKLVIYLSVAVICIVVLLMMKTPEQKRNDAPIPTDAAVNESIPVSYEKELEEKLREIISRIQGVGDVTVMLTIEGTETRIYASDTTESDTKTETETVVVGSKEALLQAIKYPEVRGVLVVCTGGDKPSIQEKVVNAVSTVLDIPTSKVYVTNAK